MWRNPNHPQPEQPPGPPESSGREIAVFERPGKGRGPDTELRMDLAEYMGYPFISLRVWTKGPDGAWFPTRRGLSVKIREAKNLADSLLEALRLSAVTQDRAGGPRRGDQRAEAPRRSQRQDHRSPARLPLTDAEADERQIYDQAFDEFAGS